jgi:plasmid stability protein
LQLASVPASLAPVATLHVRNVPDCTCEALRRLAVQHESSIAAEVVRLLRRALETDSAGLVMLLDDIEARRPVPSRRVPSAAGLIRGVTAPGVERRLTDLAGRVVMDASVVVGGERATR